MKGKMRRRINLLPPEYRERRKIQWRSWILLLGSLLIFLTTCGTVWMQTSRIRQYHQWILINKKEQSRQLEEWSGLQEYIQRMQQLQEEKRLLEEKNALVMPLLRGQVRWSWRLLQLSRTVPAEVWLTGIKSVLVEQFGEMRLRGRSFSPAAIARFMVELETTSWVEKVDLISIQKIELAGEKLWDFEIVSYFPR